MLHIILRSVRLHPEPLIILIPAFLLMAFAGFLAYYLKSKRDD